MTATHTEVPTGPTGLNGSPAPVWMPWVATTVLIGIDALFLWKYGSRLPVPFALVVAGHVAVLAIAGGFAFWLAQRVDSRWILGAALAAACIPLVVVDPGAVMVDRWAMVDTFLANAVRGDYPYAPRPGQNIPGPLPVYFLLLAPFHFIGEIGLATVTTLALLGWGMARMLPRERAAAAFVAAIVSVPVAYEVAVRSGVLFNAILLAGVVWWIVSRPPTSGGSAALVGVVAGLALSTRSVAAIPLAAAFGAAFLRPGRYGQFTVATAAGVAVFLLTLLPLYLSSPDQFARYNPLLVQSKFVTLGTAAAALLAALGLGWVSRSPAESMLAAGLPVFGIVAVAFLLDVGRRGVSAVVFGRPPVHPFDIAYFVLAVPFLLPISAGVGRVTQSTSRPW